MPVSGKQEEIEVVKFRSFVEEYASLVKEALVLVKNPKDTLDRRTIRKFRKPNPRILPAPLPSGKLVS
jgi:hypothetical protein